MISRNISSTFQQISQCLYGVSGKSNLLGKWEFSLVGNILYLPLELITLPKPCFTAGWLVRWDAPAEIPICSYTLYNISEMSFLIYQMLVCSVTIANVHIVIYCDTNVLQLSNFFPEKCKYITAEHFLYVDIKKYIRFKRNNCANDSIKILRALFHAINWVTELLVRVCKNSQDRFCFICYRRKKLVILIHFLRYNLNMCDVGADTLSIN